MDSDLHNRVPMMWDSIVKNAMYTSYGYDTRVGPITPAWQGSRSRCIYSYIGKGSQHYYLLRTMWALEITLGTTLVQTDSQSTYLGEFLHQKSAQVDIDYTYHPWMCLSNTPGIYLPIALITKAKVRGSNLTPIDVCAIYKALESAVKFHVSYDTSISEDSVDGLLSEISPDYVWGTGILGRIRYITNAWEAITTPTALILSRKKLDIPTSPQAVASLKTNTVITSSLLHLLPTDMENDVVKICTSFLHHVSACEDSEVWAPMLIQILLSNTPIPPRGKSAKAFYAKQDAAMAEASHPLPSSGGNHANGVLNKISDLFKAVGYERLAHELLYTKTWRGVNLLVRLAKAYRTQPLANAQQLCYLALTDWAGYGPGIEDESAFRSKRAARQYSWLFRRAFYGGTIVERPTLLIQKILWVASEWLTSPGSSYSYRIYAKDAKATRQCLEVWHLALDGARHSGVPGVEECCRRVERMKGSNVFTYKETMAKLVNVHKRAHLKILDKLFPPTGWTDNRHITCRLSDVCWTFLHPTSQSNPAELDIMRAIAGQLDPTVKGRMKLLNSILGTIPIGTNNVLATSIVLSSMGQAPDDLVRSELFRRCFIFRPVPGQAVALKTISATTRRTACALTGAPLPDKVAARFAAYDMMFGRSANATDWDAEIGNRCSGTVPLGIRSHGTHNNYFPPLVCEAEALVPPSAEDRIDFQQRLDKHVRAIINKVASKRAIKTTLEDFWKRRSEWMTSGSSSGATIEDISFLPEAARARLGGAVPLSKRGWAEVTSYQHILKVFNSPKPREEATASEKMENGKSRAIYGVTPEHYVINTYATQGLEERLKLCEGFEKGAEGISAFAYDNHRARLSKDSSLEMTMLDYADFNRHHSPAHQASVFLALRDWGLENGACKDWIKANEWVAASKYNMMCKFPGNRRLRVNQGMFSGTRSTDLINTILNLAYFRVANDIVAETYGVLSQNMYNVHQGDDVWVSNHSSVWARLMFGVLQQLGLIFQPLKQMFGPRRGEYLRVMYSGGSGYGYLSRALANFILRPVQNDVALDPAAWAATLHDGVSTLIRRGLTPTAASAVWRATMPYWTRIQAHPQDHKPVQYPWWVIVNPRYRGGLSCSFPLGGGITGDISALAPTYHIQRPAWLTELPQQMTNDWITQLSAKLPPDHKNIKVHRIREAILSNSYAEALRLVDHRHSSSLFKDEMSAWLKNNPPPKVVSSVDSISLSDTTISKRDRAKLFKKVVAQEGLSIGRSLSGYDSVNGVSSVIRGVVGDWRGANQNALGYRSSIAQWLASSPFKSLDIAALAYGLSPLQTLKLLAVQYPAQTARSQNALSVLLPILESGSSTLVDLVLSGSVGLASHLVPHVSKNLLSYVLTEATDMTLNAYCTGGLSSTEAVARSVIYGVDCLIASSLKVDSASLDAVLY